MLAVNSLFTQPVVGNLLTNVSMMKNVLLSRGVTTSRISSRRVAPTETATATGVKNGTVTRFDIKSYRPAVTIVRRQSSLSCRVLSPLSGQHHHPLQHLQHDFKLSHPATAAISPRIDAV